MLEENDWEKLDINQIYKIIDINESRLDYLKFKGWLYQIWFWREIREINRKNKILHDLSVKLVREYY